MWQEGQSILWGLYPGGVAGAGAERGGQRRGRWRLGRVRCWTGRATPGSITHSGCYLQGLTPKAGAQGPGGRGSGINHPRRSQVALTLVRKAAEEAGWISRQA